MPNTRGAQAAGVELAGRQFQRLTAVATCKALIPRADSGPVSCARSKWFGTARLQSEANITLEAIETGTGNTDDDCKNLTFFVSLGLVHDPEGKIATQCKNAPAGPPSLPANQANTRTQIPHVIGRIWMQRAGNQLNPLQHAGLSRRSPNNVSTLSELLRKNSCG